MKLTLATGLLFLVSLLCVLIASVHFVADGMKRAERYREIQTYPQR